MFSGKKVLQGENPGALDFSGAEDRNRTGTNVTTRRILSPLRLPVPPPRHEELF